LSLFGGLLFRPQETMQKILQKPDPELTSRLVNVVIVLIMINTAFYAALEPALAQFGMIKWLGVLLFPPLLYVLERFVFVLTSRLALSMFASDKLPAAPEERKAKWALLNQFYPYTYYPTAVLGVLGAPLSASFLILFFAVMGLFYMFYLRVLVLKEIFGISGVLAFWGPLLVMFLLYLALMAIALIIGLIIGLSIGFAL
jgi:hypothetical protein